LFYAVANERNCFLKLLPQQQVVREKTLVDEQVQIRFVLVQVEQSLTGVADHRDPNIKTLANDKSFFV